MDKELQDYILRNGWEYVFPEEANAIRRFTLTEEGLKSTMKNALVEPKIENLFGFQNAITNSLVEMGQENAKTKIAKRIYEMHKNEIINLCPQCGKLARTPKAQQCRYCGHDWHI